MSTESTNLLQHNDERRDLWNSAYDQKANRLNNVQPQQAKEYADFKLKSYDEQFNPQPIDIPILNESEEIVKCGLDIRYFIETYCGKILTPIQYKMLDHAINSNDVYMQYYARQAGSSTIYSLYLLHLALFNPYQQIGIMAHNKVSGQYLLEIIADAFTQLPEFLQANSDVKILKESITFSNSSQIKIHCSVVSFRGYSHNVVFIDNLYNENKLQEVHEFIVPVIKSSGARILNIKSE